MTLAKKFELSKDEFGRDYDLACSFQRQLKPYYEENGKLAMLRFSRGSVLIQDAEVLTREDIDNFLFQN